MSDDLIKVLRQNKGSFKLNEALYLNDKSFTKINIGCGSNWKNYPEYEGLDIVDFGQHIVADVFTVFSSKSTFKDGLVWDNSYDEVMANHFLEHFNQDQLKELFLGVYRALKVGGIFRIVVPHKDRPEAWYLVHKTFFNEETFKMFDRVETDSYAEFGKWKVLSLVTNSRGDIHCELKKV